MDGFKHEARTVLQGKLGLDQAEELLEKKYDVETALVIETSVTDAVMQVAEIEGELVSIPTNNNMKRLLNIFDIGRSEKDRSRPAGAGGRSLVSQTCSWWVD